MSDTKKLCSLVEAVEKSNSNIEVEFENVNGFDLLWHTLHFASPASSKSNNRLGWGKELSCGSEGCELTSRAWGEGCGSAVTARSREQESVRLGEDQEQSQRQAQG